MLTTVLATQFDRPMGKGRTKPNLIECEDENGCEVKLVVKCSGGCMQGEKSLAFEAIAAMLAADLYLPSPEPYVVEITPEFIESLPHDQASAKQLLKTSCKYAFGSRLLHPGFVAWVDGGKIPIALTEEAAEVYVFDAIIVNSDRRPDNPNCLFDGKGIAIFDHELTFGFDQVLFWKCPWVEDSFESLGAPAPHIFAKPYFEKPPAQLNRFIKAWSDLDDNRFNDYKNALPAEWLGDGVYVDRIISYIKEVRQNISVVAANALKVLT